MADERILIVDDEPDILSLLVYQFSQEGFRVSTAVDGRGALGSARDELPDLVVLDLMLPDIDGYEVLRTLRRDEETQHIPILLLTARKDEEERIRGFEHGADDYVTKPFGAREPVLRVAASAFVRASPGRTRSPPLSGSTDGRSPVPARGRRRARALRRETAGGGSRGRGGGGARDRPGRQPHATAVRCWQGAEPVTTSSYSHERVECYERG